MSTNSVLLNLPTEALRARAARRATVTGSKVRSFGLGLMATFCLHSPGEFWRSTLLWSSDAHRSMCQIPAPIGMPSSQQTALVHGMTVVTRNVSDFEVTGVAAVNPWH